ncbi:MAG: 2-phospho-L-lactate transferase, partial [Candidatus Limnocylindrales bacterium]
DRMLAALGHESSSLGVARLYADLVDLYVMDALDEHAASDVEALGLRALVADTIMDGDAARARLASEVLAAL